MRWRHCKHRCISEEVCEEGGHVWRRNARTCIPGKSTKLRSALSSPRQSTGTRLAFCCIASRTNPACSREWSLMAAAQLCQYPETVVQISLTFKSDPGLALTSLVYVLAQHCS